MSAPKLRNCNRCGAAFMAVGTRRVCPQCVAKEEQQFQEVKQYLRNNPQTPMKQLSDATGVPSEVIMGFLRSGRLDAAVAPTDAKIACAVCGKSISSGRVCSSCQEKAAVQLGSAQRRGDSSKQEPPGPGHRSVSGGKYERKSKREGPSAPPTDGFISHKRERS